MAFQSMPTIQKVSSFYESGKSLTVDDCVGTGRISGDTDAIYVNYSNTTVTINGGAIGKR